MPTGIVWEPIRENELTCNSSGNTRQQSSQLAEPLRTDPGQKNWDWCALADFHSTIMKALARNEFSNLKFLASE